MRFCEIKFFDPHDLSLSTSTNSPNQVLTHAARAAAFQPLCGRARAKGSGQSNAGDKPCALSELILSLLQLDNHLKIPNPFACVIALNHSPARAASRES